MLSEIAQPSLLSWTENTATSIKRRLRESYPASIGTVSRAIKELEDQKLIICSAVKKAYNQRVYAATQMGEKIHEWLRR